MAPEKEPNVPQTSPASPAVPGKASSTCQIDVVAFDADNQMYSKRFTVPFDQPLHDLKCKWAKLFNIPPSVIGFEDINESLVDTQRSPSDLGWAETASLQAVPLAREWSDAAAPAQAEAVNEKQGDRTVAGAGGETQKPPERKPPEPERTPLERRKRPEPVQTPLEKKPPEKGIFPEGKPQEKKPLEKKEKPTGKGGGKVGATPIDDDPIIFDQRNPKRPDTASFVRYEKYKKARTAREAMSLGAERGDIANDFKKGFIRRA